ncbi:MAG: hypothetical protein PF440_11425 [Thiomicrorhabdus sp.]|jgi:uncharacterized protein YdcH (DUF465 family)|nr:hypothetical protein [Thiomicrorhabdus sp.]
MDSKRTYKHGHGSDEQHRQDQALFKELLAKHGQLKRETVILENGIRSTTTAATPELVRILQEHVLGMKNRFGIDRAIRSWDPLFAALFEYKDEIEMEYHNIEHGVEAVLTTENPKLIELIQCHDATLHGFVDRGFEAGGEESPKPSWLS